MTINNLLTEWLETYQKEHIKSRTYHRYRGLIDMHIIPYVGECEISEIGRKEFSIFSCTKYHISLDGKRFMHYNR